MGLELFLLWRMRVLRVNLYRRSVFNGEQRTQAFRVVICRRLTIVNTRQIALQNLTFDWNDYETFVENVFQERQPNISRPETERQRSYSLQL